SPAQPVAPASPNSPADATVYAMVPETPKAEVAPTHAGDYSWLEGTLEFMHGGSNLWKVRYASLSEDDPFGGSVILDSDIRLERFHEGDIVHVEGELVRTRSSVYVSGPLYRVHSIRLIDQAH